MKEYKRARENSLVSTDRFEYIVKFLEQTKNISGEYVEVGTYKGGTALLIAANGNKKLYVFDTFTGLPKEDKTIDLYHHEGDFKDTTEEHVKNLLSGYNCEIHKGLFPKDTSHILTNKTFSFVHLDVDLYSSTKECLEFFYPRLNSGGILVSDDYEWRATPGVTKAINEFMQDKSEKFIITTASQGYFIKQ